MWTLSQYTQFPSWNHLFTIIGIGEIRVENGKQSRGRPVFLCIYKLKTVGPLKNRSLPRKNRSPTKKNWFMFLSLTKLWATNLAQVW